MPLTQAATLFGPEDLRIVETELAPLAEGMVRIRFGAGGICGSDMHYFRHARTGDFYKSNHLGGDHDMIAVLKALLVENATRGRADQIVLRSDHGHRMLDDLTPTQRVTPGYAAIGRLHGLAELRGAIRALCHENPQMTNMPCATQLVAEQFFWSQL